MYTLDNLHTIDVLPGEVGVTVRKGLKWAERLLEGGLPMDEFPIGVTITLVDVPPVKLQETIGNVSTVVGEGTPTTLWFGAFKNVPARFLEHEHEEESRTYTGLFSSMKRAYGIGFSEDETVTVISYIRNQ